MGDRFEGKAKRWFVVGGLLLLMGISSVGYVQAAALSQDEVNWLTYMREEEKLARDVYDYLFDLWGSPIFDKISASEQKHMDAMKTLLVKYGIPDPVEDETPSKFSTMQALYDALIARGDDSLVEALKVGIDIEVTDIADLTEGIATTTHRDIKKVYTNLRQGSLNHYDAFCSHLVELGETCKPYEPFQP